MSVTEVSGPPVEADLSDEERAIQATAHRYAREVMRPVGIVLDRMTPEQVIAPDSPYWAARRQYLELGLDLTDAARGLSPVEVARLTYLVHEELGWGDLGLGWGFYGASFPSALAQAMGRADLEQIFTPDRIGCWGITEPDHGSDLLDFERSLSPIEHGGKHSSCVAIRRGERIVIRGQKSAWVSNGSIAKDMSLFCRYDDGTGAPGFGAFLVPLDLPGVRRSPPVRKMGVRSMSDSEIFFDDVEIPASYMVCGPKEYPALLRGILVGANPGMAIFLVGVARAAFEHALAYAKIRVQGGKPIFEHQAIRLKLFDMYRKIQAARALARHVMVTHAGNPSPYFPLAASAKVTGSQFALEVVSTAFEIFGGYAKTEEYPIEKLLRDVRMGTVADGTNDVLSLMAAAQL
ncbi:hypothetical protein ACG33_10660 [Steroidobacter denitrificans]|uniref:Acyl-CoA dehydrogenase n=1 Tax=Steroidobacter denitrificans TaxID=465721 RepID=A0A127FD64_STEDE|nr:hypothetical protein ACG33_10660 [Steroidobacter denitrificans]